MKKISVLLVAFILALSGCSAVDVTPDTPNQPLPQISEVQDSVPSEIPFEDAPTIVEDTVLDTPIVLPDDSTFEIIFLDVGQADAALVSCDGEYMLIDGGNVADSNLIYSVLAQRAITELSIVVGTHAHEDHIGGLSGALNYATADIILYAYRLNTANHKK